MRTCCAIRRFLRPSASDFPEVESAQSGDVDSKVRVTANHRLILSVAVPIQHYKQVLGVVLATTDGDDIQQSLFQIRLTIFQAFAFALAITILLSLYLAGTIARPIRRPSPPPPIACVVGSGRLVATIPDLTSRGDEIGDLSARLARHDRGVAGVAWAPSRLSPPMSRMRSRTP